MVYASLVKVLGTPYTYQACIRGQEMLISSATMAAALEIEVVDEYNYPIRTDRLGPSFDTIVTEL